MILVVALSLIGLRIFDSIAELCFERDWPGHTWIGLLIAFDLFGLCCSSFGQAARFEWAATTVNQSQPTQVNPPVIAIPNPTVALCTVPANGVPCTNLATTYSNAAESAICPAGAQLTRPNSTICVGTTDVQGEFGAWAGTFAGSVTAPVLNTVLSVAPGTGTISAALAANPGGHLEIRLGCGDYHDNVSILSESFVWIHGGGVQCTAVGPADPTKPTFLIGQKGTAPQYYMRLTDMYITALGGASTSDGLQFTSNASSVHNDWGVFENLRIEAFQNNISILGGMIWTKFRNIELIDALKNNLNIVPASPTTEPINWVSFANLTSYGAAKYGVYANVGSSTTWEFDHVDIEQNANSRAAISNPDCAGFYLNSSGLFSGLTFDNESYFEANCMNSTRTDAAQIRITGSQSVYNVNIHDNFFSAASPNGCGVYIDAAASSGTIENNYAGMQASTCGADYSITNNDTGQGNPKLGFSNWTVGPNTYVNNGQGETNFNSSTGRVRYIGINAGGVTNYPQGLTIGGSNSVPVVGSPSVGHAACIKSAGPPIVIGYCSTTPTSGTCTCN